LLLLDTDMSDTTIPMPALAPAATVGPVLRAFVAKAKEIRSTPLWKKAFAGRRKDHRYYDIVEDTMHPEITHRYLMITDQHGHAGTVQPFFVTSIDMTEGLNASAKSWIEAVRRVWSGFLRTRVLMVGCVAGEGVLDGDASWQKQCVAVFKNALVEQAYKLGAGLIVFKEFRAAHRAALDGLQTDGFVRVPSMPMTKLNFDFASFDEYMSKKLSYATRKNLRRKFKAIDNATPIELTVSSDIEAEVDELYPLYLQIYERSSMHFEKLTPEFLVQLGRAMPDKVRYFVWRQNGRAIAFSVCTIDGDTICDEYIGIDYQSSASAGLYHYTFRDIVTWAIDNGLKAYASTGLSYDPKLHLKQELVPLDLYVRHRSTIGNFIMKYVVKWLDPTRHDKTLAEFSNYAEL
jgi:predicted N-acyltransferase